MGNKNKQNGFTIVELLIVIVVIGILAAITLVAFGGIRDRANNSAVQSDLKNIGALLEQHRIIHETLPIALNSASLLALGNISTSKSAYGSHYNNGTNNYNMFYCRLGTNFALVAASASGTTYRYTAGSVSEHGQALRSGSNNCLDVGLSGGNTWWAYNSGNNPQWSI